MLTPKHTIWDEIPNALQTYKKKQYKKLLNKFFEKKYSGENRKKNEAQKKKNRINTFCEK